MSFTQTPRMVDSLQLRERRRPHLWPPEHAAYRRRRRMAGSQRARHAVHTRHPSPARPVLRSDDLFVALLPSLLPPACGPSPESAHGQSLPAARGGPPDLPRGRRVPDFAAALLPLKPASLLRLCAPQARMAAGQPADGRPPADFPESLARRRAGLARRGALLVPLRRLRSRGNSLRAAFHVYGSALRDRALVCSVSSASSGQVGRCSLSASFAKLTSPRYPSPHLQPLHHPRDVPTPDRPPPPAFFAARHRLARGRPGRPLRPREHPPRSPEASRDEMSDDHRGGREPERERPAGRPRGADHRAPRCGLYQLSRDARGPDGDGWDADSGFAGAGVASGS